VHKKQLFIVLCLISLSILGSGCVSKMKYIELEARLHSTEKKAAHDIEELAELKAGMNIRKQ